MSHQALIVLLVGLVYLSRHAFGKMNQYLVLLRDNSDYFSCVATMRCRLMSTSNFNCLATYPNSCSMHRLPPSEWPPDSYINRLTQSSGSLWKGGISRKLQRLLQPHRWRRQRTIWQMFKHFSCVVKWHHPSGWWPIFIWCCSTWSLFIIAVIASIFPLLLLFYRSCEYCFHCRV